MMIAIRGKSAIALCTVGILMAVCISAPTASAGGSGDPIIADLNGDGVEDMAVLTELVPTGRVTAQSVRQCQIVLRPGQPDGEFGPAETHPYLALPVDSYCPDMGTSTNATDDPPQELVVTWFAGPPPAAVDYNLITVHAFRPLRFSQGLEQPSFIGSGDFDGEGMLDIYEWTDQGEGFATFLHDGNGGFVPGPMKWCATPRSVQLADFDKNSAENVLISYFEKCDDYSSGVVVVVEDGSVRHLQHDPTGELTWTATVLDLNGDGFLDVRTVNDVTGEVDHFLGIGDSSFVEAPRAVQDKLTVSGTKRTNINVLANDYATPAARIRIVERPRYGTVQVTSSRTIVYDPDPRHGLSDRFVYQLIEDGKTSNASVNLKLRG